MAFTFAGVAGTTEAELACFRAPRNLKILKASMLLEDAISGHDDNAFDIIITNVGDDALGTDVVARKDYDTSVDAVKHEEEELTLDEVELDEGDVLTFQKDDKGGTGVNLPAGVLLLFYEAL